MRSQLFYACALLCFAATTFAQSPCVGLNIVNNRMYNLAPMTRGDTRLDYSEVLFGGYYIDSYFVNICAGTREYCYPPTPLCQYRVAQFPPNAAQAISHADIDQYYWLPYQPDVNADGITLAYDTNLPCERVPSRNRAAQIHVLCDPAVEEGVLDDIVVTSSGCLTNALMRSRHACGVSPLVCDPGTYNDGAGACQPCLSTCSTCESGDTCSTCKSGFFDTNAGECRPCERADCEVCSDATTCTKCQTGFFPEPDEGSCRECPFSCVSCSGTVDNPQCSECKPDRYKTVESTCRYSCPRGEYEIDGGVCGACPDGCASCTGTDDDTVQVCFDCEPITGEDGAIQNTFLHNGVCDTTCPGGTFPGVSVCRPCPHACSTCSSKTDCSSCRDPFRLDGSQCVLACGIGQWDDGTKCNACASPCATCGTSADRCLSCEAGMGVYNPGTHTCEAECTGATFENSSGVCSPCNPRCDSCTGPERDCSATPPPSE